MSLDARLRFFQQPSLREIRRNRRPRYVAVAGELVDVVEVLTPGIVAVLTDRIVPVEYYSWQNFLKRGESIRLEYPRSAKEVREGVQQGRIFGPRRTRDLAFQKMGHGFYAGYEWFTPDFSERRRVLLDTCIDGFLLYLLCHGSSDPRNRIMARRYHSKKESPIFGASYEVEVPSCSRDDTYAFRLTGVPFVEFNPERVLTVRRLNVEGHAAGRKREGQFGCQFQHYMELTFKRPEATYFCHHAVAAYLAISHQLREETGRIPLQPFALPKLRTIRLAQRLRNQVLRVYIDHDGHIRYRHLNLAEREIFWMHFISKHQRALGNITSNPFFAADSIPTYKKELNLQA